MSVALASTTIGRERELEAIGRFLAGARRGFRALLLEGEPGIGKTTIFRESLRRASSGGVSVLACRPGESEATLSFAAIADLLHAVDGKTWSTLPGPQRRALEVALLQADPGERPVDRRAVAAGVRSLLTRLAAERPLLIAIDDVQWLDTASAAALEFTIRRLEPERIGVLATRRLGVAARLDIAALASREAFSSELVGPLSLGALQRLLRERFGEAFPRSMLVRIHGTSGGNPLFALEIGRALAERGAPPGGEPLPVPDDVRGLVRERVEALPDATRDLLLAAALLTHPSVETLARILGRPPETDLEPAERAGIAALEGSAIAFGHPLHAAAVVAAATAAGRRRMHLRLADAVDALEERARHAAFGADRPSRSTAALLEQGAAAARARGSLHAAAELLERARALSPTSEADVGRGRGVQAAELHIHAGDRSRARRLLEELQTEPLWPSQRVEVLRLLAEASFADEDLAASERLLLEALRIADDHSSRARIRVELVYVVSHLMDFARAAEFGHRALEDLAGSDDGPLLAEALIYTAHADYLAGRGVDWSKVERALQLEDPCRLGLPGLPAGAIAAMLTGFVGKHVEALRQLEGVRGRLVERGDESDLGYVLLYLSWFETASGNLTAAAQLADEAVNCASMTGYRSMRRWAVAQRAWVDAHLGEVEAARRGCAEATAAQPGSIALVELWIAATLALVEVSLGDYQAAWQASRELTETIEQRGIGEPIPLIFLPDALEALVALGQLDRAEALIGTLEGRGRELDRAWALAMAGRCRGLLLGARGDLPGAAAALERALIEHGRMDQPFERARTLWVKGAIERRLRRPSAARRALEEAAGEFARLGAKLWAARAHEELARLGGRLLRSPAELTPSELRVAELAAEGLSNKEIAASLFVSVHTVEVHLSKAYTKLGVRSRAQLARRLAPAAP
jgi:DNA-binding CsgD family transcriptional regulator